MKAYILQRFEVSEEKSSSQPVRYPSRAILSRIFFFGLGGILLSLGLADSPDACAQDHAPKVTALNLPAEIPPLPSASDSETPLLLTSQNVALFHEILLAPVASWLKGNQFVVRVAQDLHYPWTYSPEWTAGSEANAAAVRLDETGTVQGQTGPLTLKPGFPFGSEVRLHEEKNPEAQARKILWNSLSVHKIARETLSGFQLTWYQNRSAARKSSGIFFRQMTPIEGPEQPDSAEKIDTPVFFREFFQLFSPPVVFGLAEVTWRYPGIAEDLVWIHSPVLGRSRKVLGSNRTDGLLGGAFASEDFFVWSGKPQEVKAKVVEEKIFLLPFPGADVVTMKPEKIFERPKVSLEATEEEVVQPRSGQPDPKGAGENVPTLRGVSSGPAGSSGAPALMTWNSDTMNYPQAAPWVPVDIVFIPRKTWVIEMNPLDPFSLYGRQVLVVDQESQLPFFKIVYDRKGVYSKTVFAAWHRVSVQGSETIFPTPAFTLVVERGADRAVSLSPEFVRAYFGQTSPSKDKFIKLLDIKTHDPKSAQTPVNAEAGAAEAPKDDEAPEPGATNEPVENSGGF